MRKIHKLFLIATIALGLGFVACNDSDVVSSGDNDAKANTHVSVTLSMSTTNTRALPNDYNYIGEWAGQDKINTIAVYLVDGTSVNSKSFTVGAGQDYEASTVDGKITLVPKLETAAIKTTAGQKTVFVLVNGATDVVNHLSNITVVAQFEDAYQKVALALANEGNATVSNTSASKLAKVEDVDAERKDVITMTNVAPATINVLPNIAADVTIGADAGEAAKNRVSLEVERAVARVMVTIANADSFIVPVNGTTDQTTLGTITNVTWVLAQGENSLFVQRKTDWATPNYAWVPGVGNDDFIEQAGDKYDYSGLFEARSTHFGGTTVPKKGDYVANVPNLEPGFLDGKFILPTTHKVGEKTASDYKKGNTAYVLVRAQFTPSKTAYADGGEYIANADFYVGANGKFYTSAANALTPDNGGVVGQSVAKYVGGKVLYYAWVNPDNATTNQEWYNSPVLRNNIYHIHITGFKTIGTNWNPLFPEEPDTPMIPNEEYDKEKPEGPENPKEIPDPDAPEKENPDPKPVVPGVEEPTNPIDPEEPLTPEETWMSVDVKVLPWKVHSYQLDLGI